MASTRLTRTAGTSTLATKYTLSMWIKRSKLSSEMNLIGVSSGNTIELIKFNADNKLYWYNRDASSNAAENATSNVFRDTSAWYHLVFSYDSTENLAANQRKFYINGVNQTWTSANAVQSNAVAGMNLAGAVRNIGAESSPSNYFDGSMTHIHFIDGTVYTPTSFGEVDSTSGIWKAKSSASVTYGNNGFFLKFANSGAMGTDSSGKSNNFTVNGTLTQNIDTPDNNFATMNPLDNYWQGGTFSNGNNTVVTGNSSYARNSSTIGMSTGKWYSEYKVGSITGSGGIYIGITGDLATAASGNTGNSAFSYAYDSDGTKHFNGSASSFGDSYTTGDIIGVALDTTNNKLWWSKNGVWQASGDPSNNSNPAYTVVASSLTTIGAYFWSFSDNNNGEYFTCNCNFGNGKFGTTAVSSAGTNASGNGIFEYDVPTGYTALSTKGLNS